MTSAATWAVVLVHGVGDTEPGASLGAFLPGYVAASGRLTETAVPENRMLVEPPPKLPHSGDVAPPSPSSETGKPMDDRFPMHVRTFSNSSPNQPGQAIFAEVFWADLSRAGTTRLEVLRRTIGLIFDLRHISNVAAALPGLEIARVLRWLLYSASWLLCGPIAGVAAFVLALLLGRYAAVSAHELAFRSPLPAHLAEPALMFFGLIAAIGLIWISHWRTRSSWAADGAWSLFAGFASFAAFLTFVTGCLRLLGASDFPWSSWPGQWLVRHMMLEAPPGSAMSTHLVVLLGLAYLAFAALALVAMSAAAVWVAARVQCSVGSDKSAMAPALDVALGSMLLQVLLWIVIGTALGTFVVSRFVPNYTSLLITVKIALVLKLAVGALIALSAVLIWLRRRAWTKNPGNWRQPDAIPRLLLNTLIMSALIGFTLLAVLMFAWAFISGDVIIYRLLARYAKYAEPLGLSLVLLASIPVFLDGAKAILHILIDITSHFYRPRLRPLANVLPAQFSTQQRIEARFRRVLQEVLASGTVTHVTIVAHSQGTVIALDVLWLAWASNVLAGKRVNFVTMGSPISHLYQHYFPSRYPALFLANGTLNPLWGDSLNVTVGKWTNMYRVDDYIGTVVHGGAGFPENILMKHPGGHTGYWADAEVRQALLGAQLLPG